MKIRALHKQTPATTLISLCLAFAAVSSSCGGGSSSPDSSPTPPTPTTATLTVVLASPSSSPVSVSVDGQVLAENLSYMTSTNPLIVPSGQHQLLLQTPSGPGGNPDTLNLEPGSRTTALLIFPAIFGPIWTVVTDDTTPAPNGMAKIRIADYANNAPTALPNDVYIVPFGGGPTGTPAITHFDSSQDGTYQALAPGNYDIYFVLDQTAPGTQPQTVIYHTGSLQLAAGQNRSVYFLTTCQVSPSGAVIPSGYTTVTVDDLN